MKLWAVLVMLFPGPKETQIELDSNNPQGLLDWERHPVERKFLRQETRIRDWQFIPRGW